MYLRLFGDSTPEIKEAKEAIAEAKEAVAELETAQDDAAEAVADAVAAVADALEDAPGKISDKLVADVAAVMERLDAIDGKVNQVWQSEVQTGSGSAETAEDTTPPVEIPVPAEVTPASPTQSNSPLAQFLRKIW